jgi:NACalpha-BTF3-like transcription factor
MSSGKTTAVIKEEDIKFFMDECDISRDAAEAILKINSGDLRAAINAYICSPN